MRSNGIGVNIGDPVELGQMRHADRNDLRFSARDYRSHQAGVAYGS
ncbi:MAG TPA: hypothetical protein VFA13_00840 [Candidatus Acidoferrum sp.]|nr:hypothetical protein [Candidatus Acidoferrum sp.]